MGATVLAVSCSFEIGPHSGKNGGQVMFQGDMNAFYATSTLTSKYMLQKHSIKSNNRKPDGWLKINNASMFNIHNVNVQIPKGVLTVVTGGAGSGKSTLFDRILPQRYPECVVVNQKPITTNRRSNIATFTGIFDNIRNLSGGELQRLKLAVELEQPGKIYVFDEPTTGLHFSDIETLLAVFEELLNHGSTLIVIEHNLEMICNADWVIDLGPGAGEQGGKIMFEGTPQELLNCNQSVTSVHLKKYLGQG